MYTKLPPPLVEEVDEQKKDEEISEKGIIDEKGSNSINLW